MLELEGIGKTIACGHQARASGASWSRRRRVLQDVTGCLPAGVTVLTGPNGAGKTTLLRVLAGLVTPDCGTLRYAGQPLQPRSRRYLVRLGYLPQRTAAYPEMTVRSFLAHMAALKAVPSRVAGAVAAGLIRQLGLDHCADRPMGRISQGQARLACVAQALLNDPDVLLLDEPFDGLDHATGNSVGSLLARPGRIVLLATHCEVNSMLPIRQRWQLTAGVLDRR